MKYGRKAAGLLTSCKGSISVFQCIILVSLVIFTGVIVDIARILAAERQVQSALNTSTRSVMAYYDADLIGDYGVFGLSDRYEDESMQELFDKYLNANLADRSENFRLINYEIVPEETKVEAFGSLLGDDVIKDQIMKYMKYRAPISMTLGIIDRFKTSGLTGKINFAHKEKELRTRRKEVKEEIDFVNTAIREINSSNIEDIDGLRSMHDRLASLYTPLDKINSMLDSYNIAGDEAGKAAAKEGIQPTETEFDTAAGDSRLLKESISRNLEKLKAVIREMEVLQEKVLGLQRQLKDLDESPGEEGMKDKIISEINDGMLRLDEICEGFTLEGIREISYTEPENTESEPDRSEKTGAEMYIGLLFGEYSKYLADIDPQWLIQESDISHKEQIDRELYKDMELAGGRVDDTAQDAESRNDSALAYLQLLLDALQNAANRGMETLYLDEYIMDRYAFVTSKTERGHFFEKGEVEYILCGSTSQLVNIELIAAKIGLMRFAINSIDYFASSTNPHPLYRLIYALARGFIRSAVDISELLRGRDIALCPSLENKPAAFRLTYSDHLRIFILLQSEEEKLINMRQLMQVNIRQFDPDFRLADCDTVLHGKVKAAVNLWFIPLLKLDRLNTGRFKDGKYIISKEIYMGY